MTLPEKFDHHVHIGQFNKIYFQPYEIITSLHDHGVKGCWFSSTTSCLDWLDNSAKKMLISHIHDEIVEALEIAKRLHFDAKPLYWVIPKRHFEGETISEVMASLPYAGFKVHTRVHNWNIKESHIDMLFNEVCKHAQKNNMPIVIHTGSEECENPQIFEKWFADFSTVKFVLAHCRPLDIVMQILKQYNNVFGDSSFLSKENLELLKQNGFSERILFGTDYPVNKDAY